SGPVGRAIARQTENLVDHRMPDAAGGQCIDLLGARQSEQSGYIKQSNWSGSFCAQTPKLKALAIDGPLDRNAGKLVRRISIGPDHPYGSPGSMLLWELAPTRIAAECAKLPPRFRLEDVNAHGLGPFCA